MSDNDKWFLLIYYKQEGRTEVTRFLYLENAARAFSDTERRFTGKSQRFNPDVDVLLVGASDIDVVKKRYPSYFMKAKSKREKVDRLLSDLPAVPA